MDSKSTLEHPIKQTSPLQHLHSSTSGASEGDNCQLLSLALVSLPRSRHGVTQAPSAATLLLPGQSSPEQDMESPVLSSKPFQPQMANPAGMTRERNADPEVRSCSLNRAVSGCSILICAQITMLVPPKLADSTMRGCLAFISAMEGGMWETARFQKWLEGALRGSRALQDQQHH